HPTPGRPRVIRITLVTNALHLEAARRVHRIEARGNLSARGGVEVLILERRRIRPTAADRALWPLRLPVHPLTLALMVPLALVWGLAELRLAHLANAGRALRLLARRARRIELLDDGLDQYRERPRAVDPLAFPAGTPCWLFSDAPSRRAAWCRRFDCRELGPLYEPTPPSGGAAPAAPPARSLIIEAPGVERLQADASRRLPRPWLLVPHPVAAKRRWTLPPGTGDATFAGPPEPLIASFPGTVVVGESMTLLAALRLRPPGSPLLVALPETADPNLRRLVQAEARDRPGVALV
ncbi:MAG: hypothetical protein VKI81_05780, partial [Synechococcaceae cyanobacterium]|nr:hypothetical protein [Synechococcaceae cyanobacterium]